MEALKLLEEYWMNLEKALGLIDKTDDIDLGEEYVKDSKELLVQSLQNFMDDVEDRIKEIKKGD